MEAVAEVVNAPCDGGSSNVSRIIREFGIGEICASAIVVLDPLASPPSLPPSDEGGDQSIYLDSSVTEQTSKP